VSRSLSRQSVPGETELVNRQFVGAQQSVLLKNQQQFLCASQYTGVTVQAQQPAIGTDGAGSPGVFNLADCPANQRRRVVFWQLRRCGDVQYACHGPSGETPAKLNKTARHCD
jgi:hypothetical protein